ncbi:hypothetical protein ABDZ32_11530 [Aeromonas veronii]|uniref:hypothetical protein n=1 Tax=Aeromonas veronii TaxID=654 RepID=UPI0031FD4C17
MIHINKSLTLCGWLFWLLSMCSSPVNAVTATAAVEKILERGFPTQSTSLSIMTDMLLQEYNANNNVVSLIFHAYGLLRQADNFAAANDFINAAEYAKTGFFYLDEAVDLHENNPLVRYFRVRVDAYLAAESGRCVVALKDTKLLLKKNSAFSAELLHRINLMRYRALISCKQEQQAHQLLAQIKKQSHNVSNMQTVSSAPQWDVSEVTQVIMPLIQGK